MCTTLTYGLINYKFYFRVNYLPICLHIFTIFAFNYKTKKSYYVYYV